MIQKTSKQTNKQKYAYILTHPEEVTHAIKVRWLYFLKIIMIPNGFFLNVCTHSLIIKSSIEQLYCVNDMW